MDTDKRDKTPCWVKWGAAALAVLILAGIVISTFGQNHGPWQHFGGGAAPGGETAP